jgi:hypothetical protein
MEDILVEIQDIGERERERERERDAAVGSCYMEDILVEIPPSTKKLLICGAGPGRR